MSEKFDDDSIMPIRGRNDWITSTGFLGLYFCVVVLISNFFQARLGRFQDIEADLPKMTKYIWVAGDNWLLLFAILVVYGLSMYQLNRMKQFVLSRLLALGTSCVLLILFILTINTFAYRYYPS